MELAELAAEAKRMIANTKPNNQWKQGYLDGLIWVMSHWEDGRR